MSARKAEDSSLVQQAIQENVARLRDAVIELRHRMGDISQQALAVRLNKSIVTTSRWENSRPPSGSALIELKNLAIQEGFDDLASTFHEGAVFERNVMWIPMNEEQKHWHDALMHILWARKASRVNAACEPLFEALVNAHRQVVTAARARDEGRSEIPVFVSHDEAEDTQKQIQKLQKEQKPDAQTRTR